MPKYRVYYTLNPSFTDVEADTPEEAIKVFKLEHHVNTTSVQPLKEYVVKYKVVTTYEAYVEATSKDEAIDLVQRGQCDDPEEIDEQYEQDFEAVELEEEE